ncbi:MAG TPA: HEAT repeat domain-containing protein, partial [bacterium]|nr:HEAT repeat domain-containing protein [bacterium]
MIALAVVAALLAPHGIQSQPPALTTEQAQAKYSAECRGKNTEDCKNLRWQVEYALYEDLRFAARLNQPIDADTQHVGATADCPQLKTFILHLWRGGGMPKADQPAVIAALNDPYPRVREAAFE